MTMAENERQPAKPAERRPRPGQRERTVVEAKLPEGLHPQIGDRWEHAGRTWLILLADDIDADHARLTLIRGNQT